VHIGVLECHDYGRLRSSDDDDDDDDDSLLNATLAGLLLNYSGGSYIPY